MIGAVVDSQKEVRLSASTPAQLGDSVDTLRLVVQVTGTLVTISEPVVGRPAGSVACGPDGTLLARQVLPGGSAVCVGAMALAPCACCSRSVSAPAPHRDSREPGR